MSNTVLPELRENLKLYPGPTDRDGAPSWTIYDPVRNNYCRLSQNAFELLSFWHLRKPDLILKKLHEKTGQPSNLEELEWLAKFLKANFLTKRKTNEEVAELSQVSQGVKQSWYNSLVHNYLFFRIPIVRPDRFLSASWPYVRHAFRKETFILLFIIGALGLFLVARQWESFQHSFLHFFSWDGMVFYSLAILFAKILHELGHAYVAKRHGLHIPTMGIAFMVMWPVLYTDTSDAWLLQSKKKRLEIGFAGIFIELSLALIATFVWSFLPEGPMKSTAFILATVTWIMTLAVNLNPFMRFDGYYLLSDYLEVENLQNRSFNLAKWQLREWLFGLGHQPPEAFSNKMQTTLVGYAILTWVYRFFLFIGIALLVYTFFFKVLGILLFIVEIMWFIVLPVAREVHFWWQKKSEISLNKNTLSLLFLCVILFLFFVVPWRGTVKIPAILDAAQTTVIYAPRPAKIEWISLAQGDVIEKGTTVLKLSSDELRIEKIQAFTQVKLSQIMLNRQAANAQERSRRLLLERDLESAKAKLNFLKNQLDALEIKSMITGRVVEVDPSLMHGMWVNEDIPLAYIVDTSKARLRGFVHENQIDRISVGANAIFYSDHLNTVPLSAMVQAISQINVPTLNDIQLASIHGGEIPVMQDNNQQLVPTNGLYEVVFSLQTSAPIASMRGQIHIDGSHESIIGNLARNIWSVIIRESGF